MPTVEVVQVLEEWVKILDGTLRSLNVICKVHSPHSFPMNSGYADEMLDVATDNR